MEEAEDVGLLDEVAEVVSEGVEQVSDAVEDGVVEEENEDKVDLIVDVEENRDLLDEVVEEKEVGQVAEHLADESKELLEDERVPEISSFASGDTLIEKVEELDFPLPEEKDVTVIYWDETTAEGVALDESHIEGDVSSTEISESILLESVEMAADGEVDPKDPEVSDTGNIVDFDLNDDEGMTKGRYSILLEEKNPEHEGKIDDVPLAEEIKSEIVEAEVLHVVWEESKDLEEVSLPCTVMTNGTTEILTDERIGESEKREVVAGEIHSQLLSETTYFERLAQKAVSLEDTSAQMASDTMQKKVADLSSAGEIAHSVETVDAHAFTKEDGEEKSQHLVAEPLQKEVETIYWPSEVDQVPEVASAAGHNLPMVIAEEISPSSKGTNGLTMISSEILVRGPENGDLSNTAPVNATEVSGGKTSAALETGEHVYKSLQLNESHKLDDGVPVASSDANTCASLIGRNAVSPIPWLSCCGLLDVLYKK